MGCRSAPLALSDTSLQTAAGVFRHRRGGCEAEIVDGRIGWGEVAPLTPAEMEDAVRHCVHCQDKDCAAVGELLPLRLGQWLLFGSSTAELDALVGTHARIHGFPRLHQLGCCPPVKDVGKVDQLIEQSFSDDLKWKVATFEDDVERRLLKHCSSGCLERQLASDASGGWNRVTAWAGCNELLEILG